MNLLSPFVLGAAGVCASPALYAALTGGMPMEVAMSRYLVALGICWVALSARPRPWRWSDPQACPRSSETAPTSGSGGRVRTTWGSGGCRGLPAATSYEGALLASSHLTRP